jgi:hypothetical protein
MTTARAAAGRRDPLDQHIRLVDTVAAIAPPPKPWSALRGRWDEFVQFTAIPIRERLVAAVVEGTAISRC